MDIEDKTSSKLKRSKSIVIQRAIEAADVGDLKSKVRWELKRKYIDKQLEIFDQKTAGISIPKRVFISYSKESGTQYFKIIEHLLKENHFEVFTGFMEYENDEGNVLKRVLGQLKRCTVYLGILTKEHKITKDHGEKWSPGVWIMEEKGMAIALEKPLVLMVDEEISKSFWIKTSPEKIHFLFNKDNFLDEAKKAAQAISKRYEEYVIKHI